MLRLKSLIKLILYYLVNALLLSHKIIKKNTILLIRLDAIGDYILFRNFIEVLKKDSKFKNYEITLVGNIVWKDLAESLDKKYIDKFIWIDIIRFHKNLFYRYKKLTEISKNGYEIVLHPTYSRTFDADNIVKIVCAKEKIGSVGDLSNIKKWEKDITDKFYTKLIPAKNEIIFEFYRNKEFFENFLEKKLKIEKPTIELNDDFLKPFNLPENYVVFGIGASADYRKWATENFAKVGEYIYNKYRYDIVLCGGKKEISDGEKFEKIFNSRVWNLVGKTSLNELIYIISKSKFVISNETCIPHIAVAFNVPVVVLYNGNHFGRFTPYPKEITEKYFAIYHPLIERDLDNYKKLSNSYGYGSKLNINEIRYEKVIEILDNKLKFN